MATTATHAFLRRKIYFFSDAHLGIGASESDREKEQQIVAFLDMVARDGRELFIVGDLFDYWFEYRSVVPRGYVRLLGKLAALVDAGIAVTYLAGNHDFWMRGYLREELGIAIHGEPIERTLAGKRFYICHGDGLDPTDRGYRFLKRVFRNKVNIGLFSLLHPDLATAIARWSSQTSRKHTQDKPREEKSLLEFAAQRIREGCHVVIMGHSHVPTLTPVNGGTYVNLGDWIRHCSYAVFDGKATTLHHWNAQRAPRPQTRDKRRS